MAIRSTWTPTYLSTHTSPGSKGWMLILKPYLVTVVGAHSREVTVLHTEVGGWSTGADSLGYAECQSGAELQKSRE